MRAILTSLGLLLAVGTLSAPVQGQCCYIPPPQAPDMRGPGFLWTSPYGVTYGPNYVVRPSFPPFQGMIFAPPKPPPGMPCMGNPEGSLGFPSHLYARSPRDYFMIDVDAAANPYGYGGSSPLYPADRGTYAPPAEPAPVGVMPPPR